MMSSVQLCSAEIDSLLLIKEYAQLDKRVNIKTQLKLIKAYKYRGEQSDNLLAISLEEAHHLQDPYWKARALIPNGK